MRPTPPYFCLHKPLSCLAMMAVCQSGVAFAQSGNAADISAVELIAKDVTPDNNEEASANQPAVVRLASAAPLPSPTPQGAQSDAANSGANASGADSSFVGSIAIEGAERLSIDTFSSVVEANIGVVMDAEDLARVTQEIADLARDQGFVFATARIPEQSLAHGILTIELNEGRIDEVRIKGSDNSALAALLAPLEGAIARKDEVERRLVLAGDIPQIRVRRTKLLSENGLNILQVEVRERKNRFRARVDNYGSQRIGPVRARLSYDFNGLLADSDQGSVSVRTNPLDPEEFAFASASYSVQVNNAGTRLGVFGSFGNNQPGERINNVEGESIYAEVSASHPLVRSNDASLWLNVKAAYLTIEQDDVIGLLSQDNQVTFSAGLSSNVKFLGGRLRAGATLEQGVDLFNATREGNIFASRFDGDAVATTGLFYASWRSSLGGNWGILLSANGQISNRPLLAARELNIGGPFSVRGFDFSEVSGENGFVALAEINYSIRNPTSWIRRLQPYGFVDMGYVDNLENGFGSGTLVSSGLGLRGFAGPFNFELEGAVPLNRDRDQSNNREPHINVRVGIDL